VPNCCDERRKLLEDNALFSRSITIEYYRGVSRRDSKTIEYKIGFRYKSNDGDHTNEEFRVREIRHGHKKYYQLDERKKRGYNIVSKD